MSEAYKLILEHLNREIKRVSDLESADWVYNPVTLEIFIRDHLDLPPLSARQLQDLLTLVGPEPTETFKQSVPYNVLCMLAGKGSGKDYMASILITYFLYLLLCMRNPQAYFGQSPGEALDIIIVSYSQEQALQISFDKIKQRIKNWFWLRSKFTIIWGDKYITDKGKPEIMVLNDTIKTHNNIRIIAQHSANESYEGYNIVAFVMSESSAFRSLTKDRNGHKVYSTLRTSATSRFGKRWKGLVMSFPRYEEDLDFTYQLYNSRNTDPSVCGTKGAPWEFRPARFYAGPTFEYNGVQIPIEHKEEFDSDPDECERKYLCYPAKSGADIFTDDIIINSVSLGKEPLLHFAQHITIDKLVKIEIQGLERTDLFVYDYLLTVDLGKAHSAAALSLQHIENSQYVQDAIGAWTPDDSKGVVIDMMDVKFWIVEILKKIPRVRVAFDQWQSMILMEELQSTGVKVEGYHTYDRDYAIFKKAIALGKAKILDDADLLTQLKSLRDKDGHVRTNNTISRRKDKVDVTIGGFKVLFSELKPASGLDGYIVGNNMSEYGSLIGG